MLMTSPDKCLTVAEAWLDLVRISDRAERGRCCRERWQQRRLRAAPDLIASFLSRLKNQCTNKIQGNESNAGPGSILDILG